MKHIHMHTGKIKFFRSSKTGCKLYGEWGAWCVEVDIYDYFDNINHKI